jgi:hypothetical protein
MLLSAPSLLLLLVVVLHPPSFGKGMSGSTSSSSSRLPAVAPKQAIPPVVECTAVLPETSS